MKNLIFWAFTKNKYRGRHCLKKGGLGQFADLKGGTWQERGGRVFEGDTPMHTDIKGLHIEKESHRICLIPVLSLRTLYQKLSN